MSIVGNELKNHLEWKHEHLNAIKTSYELTRILEKKIKTVNRNVGCFIR